MPGAKSEAVRVPQGDGTRYVLPVGEDDAPMPSLLTLSDVSTGHHAAVVAKVGPGTSVAVVGDGAVGLCGVIAAKRLGAEQIILMAVTKPVPRSAASSARRPSWANAGQRGSSASRS